MVTQIPYAEIPDFCAHPLTWLNDARAWLIARGWEVIYIKRKALRMNLACLGGLAETGTVILGGHNARGIMHSIVLHQGKILDPDAFGTGILDWDDAMILIKVR